MTSHTHSFPAPTMMFEIRAHDDNGEWWRLDYQMTPHAAMIAIRKLSCGMKDLKCWRMEVIRIKGVWN